MWNKKWRSERDWNKYSSGFMLGKMKNNHGILNLALVALYSAQTHLMNVSQPLYSIPLWKYAEHMKLWHFRRLWQIRPVPFQAVGQRLYRTQSIWVWSDIWVFFSVLDNRLLADNLSQLPKVSIWLRKGWKEVIPLLHALMEQLRAFVAKQDMSRIRTFLVILGQILAFLAHFLLRFDSDKWDLTQNIYALLSRSGICRKYAFLVSFFTQIWLRQIRLDSDMTQISVWKNGG